MRRVTAVVTALAVQQALAGCGVPRHRDERYVAAELERRTGHDTLSKEHPERPALPEGVVLADGLSEDEAVAVALWNNAAFQEVLADLGFSRADLVQAGLLSNPVFSILFPLGPKQLEFTLKFPLEALWLRPKRVAVATREADRVAEALVQRGLDLVRDVKVAFADVVVAERRVQLAEDAVRIADEIVDLAEARLRAGDASELEVSSPRVEALLAKEAARRLAQDLRIARERLGVLLGPGFTAEHLTVAAAPAGGELGADVPALMEIALAARPDVRAAELAIEAGRERAGLARWEVVSIAGIADANGHGSQGFEIGPGLEMTVPVFNRNQAGKARADADLVRALRRQATVEQRVAAEVSEAHIRLTRAQEQAAIWRGHVVPELEDAVRRAERAYASGDVSILLLEQTSGQLVRVRVQAAEADADIARARAELERSVGRRLEPGGAVPP